MLYARPGRCLHVALACCVWSFSGTFLAMARMYARSTINAPYGVVVVRKDRLWLTVVFAALYLGSVVVLCVVVPFRNAAIDVPWVTSTFAEPLPSLLYLTSPPPALSLFCLAPPHMITLSFLRISIYLVLRSSKFLL